MIGTPVCSGTVVLPANLATRTGGGTVEICEEELVADHGCLGPGVEDKGPVDSVLILLPLPSKPLFF